MKKTKAQKAKEKAEKEKWENSADYRALIELGEALKNAPKIPSKFHFSFEQ